MRFHKASMTPSNTNENLFSPTIMCCSHSKGMNPASHHPHAADLEPSCRFPPQNKKECLICRLLSAWRPTVPTSGSHTSCRSRIYRPAFHWCNMLGCDECGRFDRLHLVLQNVKVKPHPCLYLIIHTFNGFLIDTCVWQAIS